MQLCADSELMLVCSTGSLCVTKANIKASAGLCSRALETSLRNVRVAASAVTELHIPNNLKEVGLFTARGNGERRIMLDLSCLKVVKEGISFLQIGD